MLPVLAMFPGQGSQYVGMGAALLREFPAVRVVFEEAEDATQIDLRKLCFDGPDADLQLTANTQPCILTVSCAVWRVLQAETGLVPAVFAGHSLGEYSALVAAGRLSLARAALLVRRRGQAMQSAVPVGVGAMAAILGGKAEDLAQRCQSVSRPNAKVEVANYNAPQQTVIAGHKAAVEAFCASLEKEGIRAVLLPVSAPFHSSLMREARIAMQPLLEETVLSEQSNQFIANRTGEVSDQYTSALLVEQIDHPVLWTKSLAAAAQHGCEIFLEVGPGKVLAGLAKRSLAKTARILSSDDIVKALADVKALLG